MKNRVGYLLLGVLSMSTADAQAQNPSSSDSGVRAASEQNASRELRRRQLAVSNSLSGTTGLMHVASADSGPTGSLRASLATYFYSGFGFLCPNCEDPAGNVIQGEDDVNLYGTRIQLSATPFAFLEGYASMRFRTVSNDRGEPQGSQIVGDTTLGAKGFMPFKQDRPYSFGGGAQVELLNRAGGVGAGAANVGLYGTGTFDLNNRKGDARKIPLRVHLNLGYWFDNSGNLLDEVEAERATVLGSRQRITRIERFGHDLNRVDSFGIGVGVEGTWEYVRPFVEWSLDIPVNRQGYECRFVSRSAGDQCLDDAGFSAVPSRVSLGARVLPWVTDWTEGLSFLAAFDVGTGATSDFLEEVAPEVPWTAYLGIGYAFDTQPRIEVRTQTVEKIVKLAPPPEHRLSGVVVDAENGEPLAQASVRFADSDRMGLLSDAGGRFRTEHLEPGTYQFTVAKEGYEPGACQGTIEPPAEPDAAATQTVDGAAATAEDSAATGAAETEPLRCELKKLAAVANVTGTVRDAATTTFVPNAAITLKDPRGRELSLTTDERGAFRFENVPAGESQLSIAADGYLRSAHEVNLIERGDVSLQLALHPQPKQPNVVVTAKELRLREQVHFLHDSAEILPDSMALVEEIAQVLRDHPDISQVEIQGHTDDSGTPEYNMRLSNQRANAVREALIVNGVEPLRLVARGYGQEQALVPNTSDQNRARNRRVQLMIVGK